MARFDSVQSRGLPLVCTTRTSGRRVGRRRISISAGISALGTYNLQVRGEFTNIFNRTQIGNPSTSNPLAAPTKNSLGRYNGGFGIVNTTVSNGAVPSITSNGIVGQLYQAPRSGTLIGRFT